MKSKRTAARTASLRKYGCFICAGTGSRRIHFIPARVLADGTRIPTMLLCYVCLAGLRRLERCLPLRLRRMEL